MKGHQLCTCLGVTSEEELKVTHFTLFLDGHVSSRCSGAGLHSWCLMINNNKKTKTKNIEGHNLLLVLCWSFPVFKATKQGRDSCWRCQQPEGGATRHSLWHHIGLTSRTVSFSSHCLKSRAHKRGNEWISLIHCSLLVTDCCCYL